MFRTLSGSVMSGSLLLASVWCTPAVATEGAAPVGQCCNAAVDQSGGRPEHCSSASAAFDTFQAALPGIIEGKRRECRNWDEFPLYQAAIRKAAIRKRLSASISDVPHPKRQRGE